MKIPPTLKNLHGSDTFSITDNTKLRAFRACPRKYFYAYVLHLRTDYANKHLEFGVAWHLAKEYLLTHGTSDDAVHAAYALFLSHFRKYFTPDDDIALGAKSSGNALLGLMEYAKTFGAQNNALQVLETEIAGQVLLDDNYAYSVKIDAVVRYHDDKLWCLDHKTASQDSRVADAGYAMAAQFMGYTFALRSVYEAEEVRGALVDVSVFRTHDTAHKRLLLPYSNEAIEEWLNSVLYYISNLELEFYALAEERPDAPTMRAFPQNDNACTNYGICPYFDLCNSHCNPLSCKLPQGYVQQVWNPHSSNGKDWVPSKILDEKGLREPTPEELAAYRAVIEERDAARAAMQERPIDLFF
jgi:hypothetical protein